MKILFITKDNPFGVGGANFAGHAYLRAFSDLADGDIDVFLSEGIKIDNSIKVNNYFFTPPRGLISRAYSVISGELHRHTKEVLKKISSIENQYDLCVFNNSKVTTGLIKEMKKRGVQVVTIHHNVEPEYVRDNTTNPITRKIMLYHVKRAEKNSYLLSDYNLFLTQQDMQAFHQLYGNSKGKEGVIGTFEFSDLPEWTPKDTDPNHLVFAITGSLCTVQGVDGISYFFEDLYKYLPKSAEIIISGRQPSQTIINYCDRYENVRLIANPIDMTKIINQADIYICPTRLGGGLKLRVMDGLKLGIPVISHACSARGYDVFVESGVLSVFKNEKEFEDVLTRQISMLEDGSISRRKVRYLYEQYFSYDAGYRRIEKIFGI